MTTSNGMSYDWANVSDEYLQEIIRINLKVAERMTKKKQFAKSERALSNVQAAQLERKRRMV